ncbi:MAG TPA: hypothetical protein DDZ51_05760 [Planctomycetaceae bacterium]|nr:hypothetical protein [Planctomycetaceae bacterium]
MIQTRVRKKTPSRLRSAVDFKSLIAILQIILHERFNALPQKHRLFATENRFERFNVLCSPPPAICPNWTNLS